MSASKTRQLVEKTKIVIKVGHTLLLSLQAGNCAMLYDVVNHDLHHQKIRKTKMLL